MPDVFAKSPDTIARELTGEVLLLNLRTSHYFGLSDVAARIWQLLEAGEPREAIIAALASQFDERSELIAADVDAFIADLLARGLLVRGRP